MGISPDIFGSLPQYNTFRHFTDGDITQFESKAKEGDADALFILGLCYMYQQVKVQNFEDAFKYFEKSAQKGHKLALFYLANLFENGYGIDINYAKAIRCYSELGESMMNLNEKKVSSSSQDPLAIARELDNILNDIRKSTELYTFSADTQTVCWGCNDYSVIEKNISTYITLLHTFEKVIKENSFEIYGGNIHCTFQKLISFHSLIAKDMLLTIMVRNHLNSTISKHGYQLDLSRKLDEIIGMCLLSDACYWYPVVFAKRYELPEWQNFAGLIFELEGEFSKALSFYNASMAQGYEKAKVNYNKLTNSSIYKSDNPRSTDDAKALYNTAVSTDNKVLRNRWLIKSAYFGHHSSKSDLSVVSDIEDRESVLEQAESMLKRNIFDETAEYKECQNKISAWKSAMSSEVERIAAIDLKQKQEAEAKSERERIAKEQTELRARKEAEAKAEQSRRDKERARLKAENERIAKEQAEIRAQKEAEIKTLKSKIKALNKKIKETDMKNNRRFKICLVILTLVSSICGWFYIDKEGWLHYLGTLFFAGIAVCVFGFFGGIINVFILSPRLTKADKEELETCKEQLKTLTKE